MSTITLRNVKGTALTWQEVDNNFTNLNTDKLQSENAGTTGQLFTRTATGAQWAALTIGADLNANAYTLSNVKLKDYKEVPYALSYSATITPDVANGNVQTITLTGNVTFNAFANAQAGQSLTLIVNTNGTGRTLTSTMKWAGGEKTLSTTNTTDIISVFYDGTNYWASLSKDFK